jgi:hypothetical protein
MTKIRKKLKFKDLSSLFAMIFIAKGWKNWEKKVFLFILKILIIRNSSKDYKYVFIMKSISQAEKIKISKDLIVKLAE